MDLLRLEQHLKRRIAEYPPAAWRGKQNDARDRPTNFIYDVRSWPDLLRRIDGEPESYQDYVVNRWYNAWSSKGAEELFCRHPGVVPAANYRDKEKDFSIRGIDFDLKLSVFPKGYPYPIETARHNPKTLINWLYANQSRQGRFHLRNRLFIICYSTEGPDHHWKIKAEIVLIRIAIGAYMMRFSPDRLIECQFDSGCALSDVIWVVK